MFDALSSLQRRAHRVRVTNDANYVSCLQARRPTIRFTEPLDISGRTYSASLTPSSPLSLSIFSASEGRTYFLLEPDTIEDLPREKQKLIINWSINALAEDKRKQYAHNIEKQKLSLSPKSRNMLSTAKQLLYFPRLVRMQQFTSYMGCRAVAWNLIDHAVSGTLKQPSITAEASSFYERLSKQTTEGRIISSQTICDYVGMNGPFVHLAGIEDTAEKIRRALAAEKACIQRKLSYFSTTSQQQLGTPSLEESVLGTSHYTSRP